MKPGKTERYYKEKLESEGCLLCSLIDPDKSFLERGVEIAKAAYEEGSDVILIGGSLGAQGSQLDETVRMIKEEVKIPVVLFPGNISGLTHHADAVYFMQMMNSRDVYWLSTAQIQAAPVVYRSKIEAIPTSYLVVEPGQAVGWIGNANLVPRARADLAAACALSARFSGSHVLISDVGSGAPEPVPNEMIASIAKACSDDVVYFCAGGIRSPKQAAEVIAAGADGIQIGTAFEGGDIRKKIRSVREAMKKEGKKRV
ncbi:geranylgeranylglyceryl/heptaprenylglyceryl phosphate synthase [Candidatus Micrarchaeota archaeon]|nr:geranylgeranylglyceryl/heptaprenylglyceryl phosphate synthase [Candidatus Micrarchaeota archaeon]